MYEPTKIFTQDIRRIIAPARGGAFGSKLGNSENRYIISSSTGNQVEFASTVDGIGSKGVVYWKARRFDCAAKEALYTNLNDLARDGARPAFVFPNIVLQEEDKEVALDTMQALADECQKRGIAIAEGETAVENTIRGLSISLTIIGIPVSNRENCFQVGDILVGVPSRGLHCNGFSTVRKVLGEEVRSEYLIPTRLYADDLLRLYTESQYINGVVHITGGGFAKLRERLPDGACIKIDHRKMFGLVPDPIFDELHAAGVSDEKMYTTFNCGVGLVIACHESVVSNVTRRFSDARVCGYVALPVGHAGMNKRIMINSAFSDRDIVI